MPAHRRAAHKAPPEQAGLGKGGEGVEVIIRGNQEEIAALVLAVQERQSRNLSINLAYGDSDDLVKEDNMCAKVYRAILSSNGYVCQ